MNRHGVFLVGSAKAAGTSTSESLARYLLERLEVAGVSTDLLVVPRAASGHSDERLKEALADADLFVVATPVYVDSLPYLLTRTLESLARSRSLPPSRRLAAAVIANCGFPEARHCETAVEIVRAFARRAGFDWAGGLMLGGGAAIDGRRLEEAGRIGRNARAALDLTARSLASGSPIPAEAVALMAKPLMPRRLYTLIASYGWRRQARRNGVSRDLRATPFDA